MNRTRGLGQGWASMQQRRERRTEKKWLILKAQCALFTQLQGPPLPSHYPISLLLSVPRSLLQHPPSLLSPAPAERLTRADEKGSSVKGQCWAATPRMPAPVQSNKAGCPPVTGCLGGKTGSFLPLCLSVHWYHYATCWWWATVRGVQRGSTLRYIKQIFGFEYQPPLHTHFLLLLEYVGEKSFSGCAFFNIQAVVGHYFTTHLESPYSE